MHLVKHFLTITKHRILVRKHCFRTGLYWQGITHDLSKYAPSEFIVGAKYYQGNQSPNNAERLKKGYSSAWLHHKGRNKHHLEYWIDYSTHKDEGMIGMRMPVKYVLEMVCDRVAASKVYNKDAYQDGDAYQYFQKSKEHYMIHPHTKKMLNKLLYMLKEEGEDKTFAYMKKNYKISCLRKRRKLLDDFRKKCRSILEK